MGGDRVGLGCQPPCTPGSEANHLVPVHLVRLWLWALGEYGGSLYPKLASGEGSLLDLSLGGMLLAPKTEWKGVSFNPSLHPPFLITTLS